MRTIHLILLTALFLSGAVFCSPLRSEEENPSPILAVSSPAEWRSSDLLTRDKRGTPTALWMPILHYSASKDGEGDGRDDFSVDLIGTLHFADREYYEELNRRFRDYDVVLVEMILPKGVKLSDLRRDRSSYRLPRTFLDFLAAFQQGAGRSLGLANQLDVIDYSAPNFVRADMDSEDFFARFQGEEDAEESDFLHEFYSFINDPEESESELEKASADSEDLPPSGFYDHLTPSRFLKILTSRDSRLHLRRYFAVLLMNQLVDVKKTQGESPRFERRLIAERNALVLASLRDQRKKGKRRIAVFYGQAHLPDLARHLESDFSLTLIKVDYLKAWNLTSHRDKEAGNPSHH